MTSCTTTSWRKKHSHTASFVSPTVIAPLIAPLVLRTISPFVAPRPKPNRPFLVQPPLHPVHPSLLPTLNRSPSPHHPQTSLAGISTAASAVVPTASFCTSAVTKVAEVPISVPNALEDSNKLPPSLSHLSPSTPVCISNLALELKSHPDRQFATELLHDLQFGCRIGYQGLRYHRITPSLKSTLLHPEASRGCPKKGRLLAYHHGSLFPPRFFDQWFHRQRGFLLALRYFWSSLSFSVLRRVLRFPQFPHWGCYYRCRGRPTPLAYPNPWPLVQHLLHPVHQNPCINAPCCPFQTSCYLQYATTILGPNHGSMYTILNWARACFGWQYLGLNLGAHLPLSSWQVGWVPYPTYL